MPQYRVAPSTSDLRINTLERVYRTPTTTEYAEYTKEENCQEYFVAGKCFSGSLKVICTNELFIVVSPFRLPTRS
jgi:hypothetical protein